MSFWVISWVVGGLVALLLALAMTRVRGGAVAGFDVQVYKDQLTEVGRDLERGVISEIEAERSRVEVSRRLLAANNSVDEDTSAEMTRGGLMFAGVVAILVFVGSFYLYTALGSVNYLDLPLEERIERADTARANRLDQAAAEAANGSITTNSNADPSHLQLMVKLRAALLTRPDDLQGHVLLAHNEASLGNFSAAHQALARVLKIKGSAVQAADYADYAEMLILAAAGYVSPTAEDALNQALQLDPTNGAARYYSGLMYAQPESGRPDLAFRLWRQLLEESTPDAPWVEPVRQQIEIVAAEAGVKYSLPPLAQKSGPDAATVAAAGEMSAGERDEMVLGMVARLADRLATDGGTPQEWAQLISALGVLGDQDRAASIWTEAQEVFASSEAALATVRAAAQQAGVAP